MFEKILLTGFEPFGGEVINPSWELVKRFDRKIMNQYEIHSIMLPTVFYESAEIINKYIDEIKPKYVLCFGQAGGSNSIRLERIAINLNDARIPDNRGNQPIDETILYNQPNAYFTKLPVRKILNALIKENILASISLSAGTYVCNHVFYHLMNKIDNMDIIGGFIHIPYIDTQVTDKKDNFSLSFNTLENALSIILESLID